MINENLATCYNDEDYNNENKFFIIFNLNYCLLYKFLLNETIILTKKNL